MKFVKVLGLAAVTAAALMAFLGASSASATILCSEAGGGTTTGTICPSGKAYASGQEIHAVNVGNVTLDAKFKNITCTSSTVKGTTGSEEGTPLTGPEGTLSFGGCNCTVNVLHAGTLTIEWISGSHNGTLVSDGNETTTICTVLGLPVHCTYVTSKTHVGTLTGGTDPTFTASAHIPVDEANSDGVCPEESTWTATYTVTTPQPLFIAGGTVKCVEKVKGNFTTESDCTNNVNEEKEKGSWERVLP
jgi:hypothetical protein